MDTLVRYSQQFATAAGTSDGWLPVPVPTLFTIGAFAYLQTPNLLIPGRRCVVTALDASRVGLRFEEADAPGTGQSNLQAYPFGSVLTMPDQVVDSDSVLTGLTDLGLNGLAAAVGVFALDADGNRWLHIGTSDTSWLNLSGLSEDFIETVAPTSGTDAVFTIPSGVDMIHISGKAKAASSNSSNVLFNGNFATREVRRYVLDTGAATATEASGVDIFMDVGDGVNEVNIWVLCTGSQKHASGFNSYYNASGLTGGFIQAGAVWDDPADLTTFIWRISAGVQWATGTRLTSRRVRI